AVGSRGGVSLQEFGRSDQAAPRWAVARSEVAGSMANSQTAPDDPGIAMPQCCDDPVLPKCCRSAATIQSFSLRTSHARALRVIMAMMGNKTIRKLVVPPGLVKPLQDPDKAPQRLRVGNGYASISVASAPRCPTRLRLPRCSRNHGRDPCGSP